MVNAPETHLGAAPLWVRVLTLLVSRHTLRLRLPLERATFDAASAWGEALAGIDILSVYGRPH
jgi:hypothetical protein